MSAQSSTPDTSYTVYNTFQKIKKKYPKASIIYPNIENSLLQQNDIIYKKINNRKLKLDVIVANKPQKKPAVILIHGGGWKSGNRSHMYPLAKEIAKRNYVSIVPEYRLSTEAIYPAAVLDIKTAIQYVKENAKLFSVDTTKIAVLGCSSGGQMAALIGTTPDLEKFYDTNSTYKHSTKVQAIIDIDGILAFKHPESKEKESASLWLGSYNEKPEIWEEASALSYTDKNTPPVLFINSDFERFHAGRDDMIKILNKNNIFYEVKTIHNSPHLFWLFKPWFSKTYEYVITFLDTVFNEN